MTIPYPPGQKPIATSRTQYSFPGHTPKHLVYLRETPPVQIGLPVSGKDT
jgi:hypothetical protein